MVELRTEVVAREHISVHEAAASLHRSEMRLEYDAIRLKQTLDDNVEQGQVHYAEPNLVVLTEVSTANVQRAVAELAREGYFDQIKATQP